MNETMFNENKNKLILGDCLEVMKKMNDEAVDLIYLDPPFFTNKPYEIIWGDEEDIRSFDDRWEGGIDHYINWLYERVEQMHRVLKQTGSIYLHCDWHADAYIRVYILDKIFGSKNFRGQVIWKRYAAHSLGKNKLDMISDSIFVYSKTDEYTLFIPLGDSDDEINKKKFPHIERETGRRYQHATLEKNSNKYNKNEIRIINGKKYSTTLGWIWTQETLDNRIKQNPHLIHFTGTGRPRYKIYLDEYAGQPVGNLWTDIPYLSTGASERIGYPTQKPLALLDRIIKASSNEGDVVMDPFMGGGTTIVAASRLNRKYIGIDQSIAALDVTDKRLQVDGIQRQLEFNPYQIEKHYYAEEDLRAMDPFEFERWIIGKFGGKPSVKQRGDFGRDGKKDDAYIQVKNWKNKVGRVEIQKFSGACQGNRLYDEKIKNKLPVGYFIAFEFSKEAVEELARLKRENGIIIEKVLVSEIVPLARKPVVRIEWAKTEDGRYKFEAISESKIINYSWDFNYPVPAHKHPDATAKFNPSVLYDKKGVRVHNFSESGGHNIAVKVVDDKYLENIAVCSVIV